MTAIRIDQFRGLSKRLAAHLISGDRAQEAVNARLDRGMLEPWNAPGSVVSVLPGVGDRKTLYRWADSAWFHWPTRVSAVRGPIPGDTENRTYYTGDGVPKMTYAGIATVSGDGLYPSTSYRLGVPAPVVAPVATVTGTSGDDEVPESRAYVYTYVSAKGEEGPPSLASNIVTVRSGESVDLASMDTGPAGNYNITQKRIYRTSDDGIEPVYRLVATVAVANTTYQDSATKLGELLPSLEWSPPPDDLAGLIALPNGVLAGFSGNQLCLSVPDVPHAWPFAYRYTVNARIVAIGAISAMIFVATTDRPEIAQASHPSAVSMAMAENAYPCVSAPGLVDTGSAILYPGPDGLMAFTGSVEPRNITEDILSPEQWQALAPESMHGYRAHEDVVLFYDTGAESGALLIDPSLTRVTRIEVGADAAWHDPDSGDLYIVQGNNVRVWNAGAPLTYRWRSKVFESPKPINPGWMEVSADAYPVNLELIADGVSKRSGGVTSIDPAVLPARYLARRFEVEISGTAAVRHVALAESVEELSVL